MFLLVLANACFIVIISELLEHFASVIGVTVFIFALPPKYRNLQFLPSFGKCEKISNFKFSLKFFNKLIFVWFSAGLNEIVGELFLPHDMPEPPKASFFQGLFGGGVRQLDREELCKLNFILL